MVHTMTQSYVISASNIAVIIQPIVHPFLFVLEAQ